MCISVSAELINIAVQFFFFLKCNLEAVLYKCPD